MNEMSNSKGIGAPKGGRVHWLLWELGSSFKGAYKLYFDYAWHKYVFYRMEKRTLLDVFIVMQTSRHCWRCMYSNTKTNDFDVFSCTQTRDMALHMWLLWKKNEKLREIREKP